MWPDQPYAEARGSFVRPVPMPTVEPTDDPKQTVAINCQYLPYIRGALQQLLLQATWKKGTGDLLLTQQRIFNLIDLFQECSSAENPVFCSGDARFTPSPFGVWSLFNNPPTIGVYVPMAGWQSDIAVLGGSAYNGMLIDVLLDSPVSDARFTLTYDLSQGQVNDPSEDAMFVYDLANHALLPGALTFAGITQGTGINVHFGPAASPSNHFLIRLLAASSPSMASPSPAGLAYLIVGTITGTAPAYDCG